MKKIALLILVFIVSCSYNVEMVSKDKPLPPYQGKFALYMPKNDCMPAGVGDVLPIEYIEALPLDYKVIATISYYNWGKFRIITTSDVASWLETDARTLGANAIIIDSCNTVYSGFFSKGKNITGRAILLQ